jgi:hypothetical protein
MNPIYVGYIAYKVLKWFWKKPKNPEPESTSEEQVNNTSCGEDSTDSGSFDDFMESII